MLQLHSITLRSKYQFSELLCKPWLQAAVPANIISGFKSYQQMKQNGHNVCVDSVKMVKKGLVQTVLYDEQEH